MHLFRRNTETKHPIRTYSEMPHSNILGWSLFHRQQLHTLDQDDFSLLTVVISNDESKSCGCENSLDSDCKSGALEKIVHSPVCFATEEGDAMLPAWDLTLALELVLTENLKSTYATSMVPEPSRRMLTSSPPGPSKFQRSSKKPSFRYDLHNRQDAL